MTDVVKQSKTPSISVVVEGYNESHDLGTVAETLHALLHQDFPLDQVEVILIGHSAQVEAWRDLSAGWTSFFRVQMVEANGSHYYELKNKGAQIASADIVAFTDSDAYPKPSWLSSIVEGISSGADVVVGPSLYRSDSWGPETALMLAAASISWGFVVGKCRDGQTPPAASLLSHNVAFRADTCRQFPYRTDLGRPCGSSLLYRTLDEAGVTIALQRQQQVAHSFSFRWWLSKLHLRYGYEIFLLRRLDKAYPNQWIARMRALEPLVTMVWHILLDIPRWSRFGKILQISLPRRLVLLPVVVIMSFGARASEMVGMYATLFVPKAMKRWAELN